MSNSTSQPLLQCPSRLARVSFRLVDEHGCGKPYAGLTYRITDRHGLDCSATLDDDGYAQVDNVHGGPLVVSFPNGYVGSDPWYRGLLSREHFPISISALQVAAEQSPAGPRRTDGKTYLAQERAAKEDAYFLRAEVSDLVTSKGHLPSPDQEWTTPSTLKLNAGSAAAQPGVALGFNRHHVIEIKALRAYNPLLSRAADFCALNAYCLAVMSAFVYAPFSTASKPYSSAPPPYSTLGSIGYVLQNQLGRRIRPTQFNTASPYHLLCEEVPYSKRLEIMPYDPPRYEKEAQEGWRNPEDVHFLYDTDDETDTDTQAFITHNDKVVLISVRGTQELLADASRDADARQVPYEEGEGQAHRGFYEAFQATKPFVNRYLNAFYTGEQTLVTASAARSPCYWQNGCAENGRAISSSTPSVPHALPMRPSSTRLSLLRITVSSTTTIRSQLFHCPGWTRSGSWRFPARLWRTAHQSPALRYCWRGSSTFKAIPTSITGSNGILCRASPEVGAKPRCYGNQVVRW